MLIYAIHHKHRINCGNKITLNFFHDKKVRKNLGQSIASGETYAPQ